MSNRICALFLALLFLFSAASAETILWEDENGQLILNDGGELAFIAPGLIDEEPAQALPAAWETFTPAPSAPPSSYEDVMAQMAQKYGLHTPISPTRVPPPASRCPLRRPLPLDTCWRWTSPTRSSAPSPTTPQDSTPCSCGK